MELVPSIQALEPTALAEVAYQVYEIIIRKEVLYSLAPRYSCLVETHVQVSEDDGVPEPFQGLIQVRQVF